MIWENAHYLWLLLLVPSLFAVLLYYRKKQKEKRAKFFDRRLTEQLSRNYWKTGDKIRLYAFLASLFFFIVALAGPKIGTEVREVQQKGVNMMVALDLSRSMNTEDVRPSRLEKAKFEINRLIDRLQGDRIGLLVFTEQAYLQVPFTADYSALKLFIDILNTDQMSSGGTDFSAALSLALNSFQSLDEQEQGNAADVLLLVGDGENHGPGYDDVLNRLIEEDIVIFSVGVGTLQGGPIPVYNDEGTLVAYHKDNTGQTVTSRLEPATMQEIAREGGGEYYQINSGSDNIEPFFSKLDELERGEFSSQEFADYKNQYQVLLMIGIILFCVSIFLPESKSLIRGFGQS